MHREVLIVTHESLRSAQTSMSVSGSILELASMVTSPVSQISSAGRSPNPQSLTTRTLITP